MKCQILFTGNNKKTIMNLSFAESAQKAVMVKIIVYIITNIQNP